MENNIPAFPEIESFRDSRGDIITKTIDGTGMTLLDHFAGQALEGSFAISEQSHISVAENCYKLAAAMLEERKKYIK